MLKHNYKNYTQCKGLGSTEIFLHDEVLILGFLLLPPIQEMLSHDHMG